MTKYPRKARAASLREARKRALRPPRPSRSSGRIAEALAKNTQRRCEAPNCFRPRRRLGKFCRDHGNRYYESGHPIALNIGPRKWRPFVRRAERFVGQHLVKDHAAITSAIRWIANELKAAESPARFDDPVLLGYWIALDRVRCSGVEVTELLARWVASELADDRYTDEPGPRYASDTHAAHQRARLLLCAKPLVARTWAKRQTTPNDAQGRFRLPWRVRAYAFNRWNSVLGLLTLKAVEAMRQQQHSS